MADQYIIESLLEGRFLTATEVDGNENLSYTAQTVRNHFGSFETFRFRCMCEVMTWEEQDIDGVVENHGYNVSQIRKQQRKHRTA